MILLFVDDSLPYLAFALPRLALARSATLLHPWFRWLGIWLAVGENFSKGHGRFLHFLLFETALSDMNTVTNSRHDGMGSTLPNSTFLQSDPQTWYCLSSSWHLTALYYQGFDYNPLLLPPKRMVLHYLLPLLGVGYLLGCNLEIKSPCD